MYFSWCSEGIRRVFKEVEDVALWHGTLLSKEPAVKEHSMKSILRDSVVKLSGGDSLSSIILRRSSVRAGRNRDSGNATTRLPKCLVNTSLSRRSSIGLPSGTAEPKRHWPSDVCYVNAASPRDPDQMIPNGSNSTPTYRVAVHSLMTKPDLEPRCSSNCLQIFDQPSVRQLV